MLHVLLSPIQFPYQLWYWSIWYGNAIKFWKFHTIPISSCNYQFTSDYSPIAIPYDQCISPRTMVILWHRFCLMTYPVVPECLWNGVKKINAQSWGQYVPVVNFIGQKGRRSWERLPPVSVFEVFFKPEVRLTNTSNYFQKKLIVVTLTSNYS